MALVLPLLLLVDSLRILSAYSESYRAVHLAIKNHNAVKYASLDLVTQDIGQVIAQLCIEYSCSVSAVSSSVNDWVDKQSGSVCNTAYVDLLLGTRPTGLSYPTSDKSMLAKQAADELEVKHLLRGSLVPRSVCSNSSTWQSKDCKYAKLVGEYRIYPPLPFASLSFAQWSYLFEFGDDLFNQQLYAHAEAWCYHLVHNLLYFDGSATSPVDLIDHVVNISALTTYQHKLLIRGSLLLAEVAKLKGQLEVATYYSLRAIRSHNILSADQSNASGTNASLNFAIISRLRILLTIPPTPPEYADAEMNRRKMVQDLLVFKEDIADSKVTLSVQVNLHVVSIVHKNSPHNSS